MSKQYRPQTWCVVILTACSIFTFVGQSRAQRTAAAQQSAEATYETRRAGLEQQLVALRAQGVSDTSPNVRDVEGQLLTLVGEHQEMNRVVFVQSKGLFTKPNVFQIPVLYVTDRQRSPQNTYISSARANDDLEYGIATTTIKSEMALRTDLVPNATKLSQDTKDAPPTTHVLQGGMKQLLAEIDARKTDSSGKPRRVLLFIHGYKNSFDSAVESAATLAAQVQFSVIPIAYCWPSANEFSRYPQDEDQERASEVSFGDFLAQLIKSSPVEVVVVAHSMGSRLLTSGLYHVGETNSPHTQLRHVIYAAADIAQSDFATHWPKFKFADVGFTIYSSDHDSALDLSGALHTFQRLGDARPKIIALEGAYCIDASSVDPWLKGVGHSYITSSPQVAADIGQWVETNALPQVRGLVKASNATPQYFVFP